MTWQPIETAPGEKIVIVYCPKFNRVLIAMRSSDTSFMPNQWRARFTMFGAARTCEPSHWMPLPNPPEQ